MSAVPAAELELPARAQFVGVARRFVRDTLARWNIEDLSMTAQLVVSELVSNSILHARPPLLLRLRTEPPGLVIEVCDDSPVVPAQRHYSPDATTGRGLGLVSALSGGDWGARATGSGKVVWARVFPGSEHEVTIGGGLDPAW